MLDILKDHLTATETSEFLGMIDEAYDLFVAFNLSDFDNEYAELLVEIDNLDNGSQLIYGITRKFQLAILREHGVLIDDENENATVSILSQILRTILEFEDSEMVEEIETIYSGIQDPKECTAAMFHLLTPSLSTETLMLVMDDLVERLPVRILEVVRRNKQQVVLSEENRIKPEYQKFVKMVNESFGMTHIYLQATMYSKILSFKEYTDLLLDMIPEDHQKINTESVAKELVVAAVISNAGNGIYVPEIRKFIDVALELPLPLHTQLITQVDLLINKLATFATLVKSST